MFAEVSTIEAMFSEELGLILEVKEADVNYVIDAYTEKIVPCNMIGHSMKNGSDPVVSCISFCEHNSM